MSSPIATVATSPLRNPTPLDYGDGGGGGEAAPVPESPETPTGRAPGFGPEAFDVSSNVAMVEDQGERIKELERKLEEQTDAFNDLKRIVLLLESAKKTTPAVSMQDDEENAKLKQEVKELKGAIDEMKEANVRRAEREAADVPPDSSLPAAAAAGLSSGVPGLSTGSGPHDLDGVWDKGRLAQVPEAYKCEDDLKPMHPKDMKPPPEFGGSRKDFLSWHESFTSMLRVRSTRWTKVVNWIKARREKKIQDDRAKDEFMKYQVEVKDPDAYIEKNFELFSKHLYRYLLDHTKDQVRIEVMANK